MHVLPTVECKFSWDNDISLYKVENYSCSSLIHAIFWEQSVEQLLHHGSEQNCSGESTYKLIQNRWSKLKIKHYLWQQVQFELGPGSSIANTINCSSCNSAFSCTMKNLTLNQNLYQYKNAAYKAFILLCSVCSTCWSNWYWEKLPLLQRQRFSWLL